MAYTKTSWTNGSGQALNETNLNKMEQGIYDAHQATNIKTWYESNADTNAFTDAEKTLLGGVETRISHLESTGITILTGNSLAPQSITTSATKVVAFDAIGIQSGTHTSGSVVNQRATALTDGVYKLRFEMFVSYASNVTITWQIYKNGAPFGNSIDLAGHGAEVFNMTLISATSLSANDYIELYAIASSTTNITVSQSNGTLEKTHYTV